MKLLVPLALLIVLQDAESPSDKTRKRMEGPGTAVTLSNLALPSAFQLLMMEDVTFFPDPVAVPKPGDVKISLKSDGESPFGKAFGEALKAVKLTWTVYEGLVVITDEKGKAAFEGGSMGGPKDEDLKKKKDPWEKLRKPADISECASLDEAFKALSKASGVSMKADALKKEKREEKPGTIAASLPVLAHLRLLARARGFLIELKGDDLVLKPEKK